MTKQEFIDTIVNNHRTGHWLNATFDVEGRKIGVKAYGKWIQRLEHNGRSDGTVEARTVKAFRSDVEELYEGIIR